MKAQYLEKMLANPTGFRLFMLNRILSWMIPFNAPHCFRILEINADGVKIFLPYKRKNFNHLKGIHACALATVGEFSAGMSLLQTFNSTKYRLILSKLSAEYLYQAKSDVTGQIKTNLEKINQVKSEIQSSGKSLIELETVLTDDAQNIVAKVQTVWQLKAWDKVKTQV